MDTADGQLLICPDMEKGHRYVDAESIKPLNLEEKQILSYDEIKDIILNTKNHYLIAIFIVHSNNYHLIKDIYSTIENLILCIGLFHIERAKKSTLIEKLIKLEEDRKIEKYDDMLEVFLKTSDAKKKSK